MTALPARVKIPQPEDLDFESTDPAELLLAHRGAWRDYLLLAAYHEKDINTPDDYRQEELQRIFQKFSSGDFDFEAVAHTQKICDKHGWQHPFGYNAATKEITITRSLLSAILKATEFSYFHQSMKDGAFPHGPYFQFLADYMDQFVEGAEGVNAKKIANNFAFIESLSFVSSFAVSLRADFENAAQRPMTSEDWDSPDLQRDLKNTLLKLASLYRPDLHDRLSTYYMSEHPFEFADATDLSRGFKLKAACPHAIRAYKAQHPIDPQFNPVNNAANTGCPALQSISARGNYLGDYINLLLAGIAYDFWEAPKLSKAPEKFNLPPLAKT